MKTGNLFEGVPDGMAGPATSRPGGTTPRHGELVEVLSGSTGSGQGAVRVERIVSAPGYASPPGFWYEQEETEWVMVVKGEAVLRFEEGNEVRDLKMGVGDWVEIAAGCRHRVEGTAEEGETVWVAVFF